MELHMDRPRVLIVDDEENIRFTLSQALVSLPVETDTAAGGQQALAKVAEAEFSVSFCKSHSSRTTCGSLSGGFWSEVG
jgi:CheY-like chemotaxis protein